MADGVSLISKKRKFVKKGVFYAELNDFLRTELEQDMGQEGFSIGYAGVEVRNAQTRLEVIIRATKTTHVVGQKGRRIRELTSLVKKRFKIPDTTEVELFAERVQHRALCALAQAEAVKFKLMEGIAVRRACYRALRFIMENDAKGCEIIVSGKLRGQRAKAMKFKQGYMIASGNVTMSAEKSHCYIDSAVKHVKLRQGVLGIKVKIMLPHDPAGTGKGPIKNLPDIVKIHEPVKRCWEIPRNELQRGYAEAEVQEEAGMDDPQNYDPAAVDMGGYEAQPVDAGYDQVVEDPAGPTPGGYADPSGYGAPEAQPAYQMETPGGEYASYQ